LAVRDADKMHMDRMKSMMDRMQKMRSAKQQEQGKHEMKDIEFARRSGLTYRTLASYGAANVGARRSYDESCRRGKAPLREPRRYAKTISKNVNNTS
jgi:hypothetical protein